MKNKKMKKDDMREVKGGFNPDFSVIDELEVTSTNPTLTVGCKPTQVPIRCTDPLNWPQDCKW